MQEVTIHLPQRGSHNWPYGTRVSEIFHKEELDTPRPIGALVNNDIASLSFKVEVNAAIEPVYIGSAQGSRIYRSSLCFLLGIASKNLFPEGRLVIGHSLGDGYFYYFDDENNVSQSDLDALHGEMKRIVNEQLPITRHVLSYTDALKHFEQAGQKDTALLIQHRNDAKIAVYKCGDYIDLSHGPLIPDTGFLKTFALKKYDPGFLLRYPTDKECTTISEFTDQPALFAVYKDYKAWGKILNVSSVGKLNELVNHDEIKDFIRIAESLHQQRIMEISQAVQKKKDKVKIILVAGPSSSGKTTFTKKISIQLKVLGFNPIMISLDDYFVPRELTPKDENGEYDFETIHAIDIPRLNEDLLQLFSGRPTELPIFDFKTGNRKSYGRTLQMEERNIIIMEGIHGLNPALTPHISDDLKFKIYVSALTQLNLDDHNRIPTTDNRLLRRMVRDYQFRGYSALETIQRWPSVRRGEETHIFPYQNNAHEAFNSALDYELAVLKLYAEPLLLTIKPSDREYSEAVRLMNFLNNFKMVPPTFIPDLSILREFIGESGFKY